MIKNMKIRKSLIMGFGITIVVSAIIIIVSLVLMAVQKGQYTDILDQYVASNELVSECRIDYNIAARNLRDAVLSGDMSSVDATNSKISELSAQLTELSNTYPLDDKTELNDFQPGAELGEGGHHHRPDGPHKPAAGGRDAGQRLHSRFESDGHRRK